MRWQYLTIRVARSIQLPFTITWLPLTQNAAVVVVVGVVVVVVVVDDTTKKMKTNDEQQDCRNDYVKRCLL